MADPRYFELWNRKGSKANDSKINSIGQQPNDDDQPVALPSGHGFDDAVPGGGGVLTGKSSQTTSTMNGTTGKVQVRLDTPGGVTYSPSDLSSHNVIKRMFIPYTIGQGSSKHSKDEEDNIDESQFSGAAILPVKSTSTSNKAKEYDFEPELRQEVKDPSISEARKYALSINLQELEGRPEGGRFWNEIHDANPIEEGEEDKASLAGQSKMTTASTRTTATVTTLATQMPDSSLPDWFRNTSAKKDNAPFTVPPSFTKKPADYQEPWKAMRWNGHRAFERPSQKDIEKGIAPFADINGQGRAPTINESNKEDDDGATIRTNATFKTDARQLDVADLFVLDPRITRPLRMIRRTDPRQVLLLCNGVYIESNEVASIKAAQAARQAGLDTSDLSGVGEGSKKAQELLSKLTLSAEARGGIGILYCPSDDPLNQDEEQLKALDPRFEVNTSKRLESAPTFARNSERRAQLRAVVAALELANWEEEGFDKIVIGVEQSWIVRGITVDIWRWRHTGWKLNEQGPLGNPGDSVPDRDLWEVLDEAVRKYEVIDCNVRFWHVRPRDVALAKKLARKGALKDVPQRGTMVRWRKKTAPPLAAEAERRKKIKDKTMPNHQGPTLTQVR
jgi:ribonuclease HI